MRFALIGEKLGHSLSVPIHEAIWQALGVRATYELIEIPRDELAQRLPVLMQEMDGLNVTIPYKQAVMPYLRALSPQAERAGAVNTILCADALGANTDILGFETMLRRSAIDPMGQPCAVLGTGGAAQAVRVALEELGAASVAMVSRHPGEGQLSYAELTNQFHGILVNTTPAGMRYQKDTCPLAPDALAALLPRATAVVDVIYNPRVTPLLAAAQAAGLPTADGLVMLVAQAAAAESMWLMRDIPDTAVEAALHRAEEALS